MPMTLILGVLAMKDEQTVGSYVDAQEGIWVTRVWVSRCRDVDDGQCCLRMVIVPDVFAIEAARRRGQTTES